MENTLEIKFRLTKIDGKVQLLPQLKAEFLDDFKITTVNYLEDASSSKIFGQLRLTSDIFNFTLHVVVDSVRELAMTTSMFNMAAAHHATFKFELQESVLKILMVAPTETISKRLQNFFELISEDLTK